MSVVERINIGIDLGTSNTVVAYEKGGEIQYLEYTDSAELIGNRPAYILPSEVFIPDLGEEDNAVQVGGSAEADSMNRIGKIVTSPKSSLGTGKLLYDEDGEHYTSEDIYHMMVTKIYRNLKELKNSFPIATQFHATVAIPVTFNLNEIREMLEAIREAVQENYEKDGGQGICLSDIEIIHEPVAAYIACRDYEEKGLCMARNIMVIDMGGGTLDISAVRRDNSTQDGSSALYTKRLGGSRKLGGDAFDEILGKLITERINDALLNEKVEDNPDYNNRIRIYRRRFKEKLQNRRNEMAKEKVDINYLLENLEIPSRWCSVNIEISRAEYYKAAAELIQRVKKEIEDAQGKSAETYDNVLVVGGMSAEPFLREYVWEKFGEEKTILLSPSAEDFYGIVAKGAAIRNGNTDLTVINTALYSIGVKMADGRVDTIFEADRELDHVIVEREYEPAKSNRYSVRIPIVEFDKKMDNAIITELSTIIIDNIPQGKSDEQTIVVKFTINRERNIEVEAYAKVNPARRCDCKIVF